LRTVYEEANAQPKANMFAKKNVLEGVGEWEVEVKCKNGCEV